MITSAIYKLALSEAELSVALPHRVGAVIFRGKRILGSGRNSNTLCSFHRKYVRYAESVHAEQAALKNLDWNRLTGASILVIRLTRANRIGLAKPCPMCQKLLDHVGIKKIFFSTNTGEILKL